MGAGILAPGGVVNSALSLSVTTIGCGVLAIPATFQDGGIFFVLFILAMIAMLTVVTIDYLVLCVDVLGLRSYEDISRELLGRTFEHAVRWILIVYITGIAAAFIVVIGEILTPMLPLIQPYFPFLTSSAHVMALFWLLFMLPLSCVPKITELGFVSALAFGTTMFLSCSIVYRYFFPFDPAAMKISATTELKYFSFSFKGALAIPVAMFSFDCQSLSFQIYTNLLKPNRQNMFRVTCLSVGLTGSVYAVVGFFGYASWTPHITGSILRNYDPVSDRLFAVTECLYTVTIALAYALVLFPGRDALLLMLFGYNTATKHQLANDATSKRRGFIATLGLGLMCIMLALTQTNIVRIIAFLGGLCSSTVSLTYPAAFRIMLHVRGIARARQLELAVAVFTLLVGVAGGIFGTIVAMMY